MDLKLCLEYLECETCCESFDDVDRRPKILQCGHTYCSQCITKDIAECKMVCQSCHKPYNAKSAEELPLNVIVDRLVQNLPKVEDRKADDISTANANLTSANDTLSILDEIAKDKDKNIKTQENKIKYLNREIDGATKIIEENKISEGEVQNEIACGKARINELIVMRDDLQNATSKKDITDKCKGLESASTNIIKWVFDASKTTVFKNKIDSRRSNATFTFSVCIQNFSKSRDIFSESFYCNNMEWKIMVSARYDYANRKTLGVFLKCCENDPTNNWFCKVNVAFKLLPTDKIGKPAFIRRSGTTLHQRLFDWGYANFIEWSKLINPNEGYMKNNTITVEVEMEAEYKGIRIGRQIRQYDDLQDNNDEDGDDNDDDAEDDGETKDGDDGHGDDKKDNGNDGNGDESSEDNYEDWVKVLNDI